MVAHPYKSKPDSAFWDRFISAGSQFSAAQDGFLIGRDDRVASAGSCFAANIVPYLENSGLSYVKEEPIPSAFSAIPLDNFSYSKFSAAYGNVYTARQFVQLLDRAYGDFRPSMDRWHVNNEVLDPFRPGLRYRARSDREFDALTNSHLSAVRRAFETATVVIFTLGLTEAWRSKIDGAVYPACPGTVAGEFDPDLYEFHNFSVAEIVGDLEILAGRLFHNRPDMKLILTVSPAPLVATATASNVVVANTYSKSVLRAAAGEFCEKHDRCTYFPAYEIITGPQAPFEFFEPDRRNVSELGVQAVMDVLLAACEGVSVESQITYAPKDYAVTLSRKIQQAECEEEASAI
jgi:hypothetical protein